MSSLQRLFFFFAALLVLGGCAQAERMVNDAMNNGGRDLTASEIDWNHKTLATTQVGTRLAYDCPPNPSRGGRTDIWGSNPYTSDSAICRSAVHAGAISFQNGGRVVLEVQGRRDRYPSSTRNGVSTSEYGPWSYSYVVLTN